MNSRQTRGWLIVMALVLLATLLVASQTGAIRLSLISLWQQDPDSLGRRIWLDIRLPRVLLAALVGLALAVSGTVMQGLFRNPLADPGLLGISSGAGLAVAIAIVIPLALPPAILLWLPMIAAFTGSLLVTALIFKLSQFTRGHLSRLLLFGVAINAVCGAIVGVLSWVSNDQQLRQLSLWGMGSLAQAQWPALAVCALLILPSAVLTLWFANRLNLLQLGEEDAHYMGVNVQRTQRQLLVLNALLVGTAVSVSGVIGFIGLVIPHLMRMCFGSDHRRVLPASALSGAILLLVADTLGRTLVSPAEMPVGLLTSLIGAPWFFWLIIRRQQGNDDV
ncbi:iron ABC transporter [Tatumella morbirosei]|uniref:Iron ABC transporter n=1 Tax=Tatumella morbirosei TaxID=642227 RepID=A0A095UJS1_9GAMM|nr:iron ABC transporter [Tatumella morbirosei]